MTARPAHRRIYSLEAFLVSTGIVALAEMGDKTQLLALVLAGRYRQRGLVVLGILAATIANHALAAAFGAWITSFIGERTLRWILAASFVAMAAWMMVPDSPPAEEAKPRLGPFMATLIAFFIVEIGDKTQIATVALAARYPATAAVVAGTTLGMMIANVPAVYLGEAILKRVPVKLVHAVGAGMFLVLGVLALL